MSTLETDINVVLVHGAWADGSSWSNVIRALRRLDLRVIAAPLPLASLQDDTRALEAALERTTGPLILVGHSYGGAVISAMQNSRVRALCFVAGLTPDEGESVAQVFFRHPEQQNGPSLAPDSRGYIWLPEASFPTAFAQHANPEQAALLAATQRPISVLCIEQVA